MVNIIEVCVSKEDSTTKKGKLLEDLGAELLRVMNYKVTNEVRLTGMEVDLIATNKSTDEKIYVECKAHKNTLAADVITKLLGNVDFNDVSSGWLITTGPLGKDAKGTVDIWNTKDPDKRRKLQFYTSEKLVERLIDANKIVSPLQINIDSNYNYSPTKTLLITEFGRFWAFQILNNSAGVAESVHLFNAETGSPVLSYDLIDKVSKLDSSLSELEFVHQTAEVNLRVSNEIKEESRSVVAVSSGDQWSDYRPSRPKDFVGRQVLQNNIFDFFNDVVNGETNTRLVAIKSPSGWGKSSTLLKISSEAKMKYKNKVFIHSVDVRAANSPRYAEYAFLDSIKTAISSGFIKRADTNLTLSSIVNPFNDPSIKRVIENLKLDNKVLVLFFDQFEEILSKNELEKLFDNIKQLAMAIDSEQENLVLGFAWKTDGSTPTEHSAYHMWQGLADRRKEFELSVFSPKEIEKALKIFAKEIGMPLNKTLKSYLVDHCQGYPWLLKKLCIHVNHMLENGSSQVDVLGQGLNIEGLFQKDLNELSGKELDCLKTIAENSPAEFHKIGQNFGDDVVDKLVKSRLVIRKGHNLILYWDIFKDYVLTGSVPNIAIKYIPQSNLRRYYEVLQLLVNKGEMSISELAANLGLKKAATENIIRDMVMMGNLERKDERLLLLQENEYYALKKVYEFLTHHVLYITLLNNLGEGFSIRIEEFKEMLLDLYSDSNFSQKTSEAYLKRIIGWFTGIGLVSVKSNEIIHNKDFKVSNLTVAKDKIAINGRKTPFLGVAPPKRTLDLIEIINTGENISYSNLQKTEYRNSLTVLFSLGMLIHENDNLKLYSESKRYEEILAKKVWLTETIQLLNRESINKELSSIEAGDIVNSYLGRDWGKESKRRNGNALLRWYKWVFNRNVT